NATRTQSYNCNCHDHITKAHVPESRVIADSEARNCVALVPAAQHHVCDHAVLIAGDIIAIATHCGSPAKFIRKFRSERMRMKKAHGLGVSGDRGEKIA